PAERARYDAARVAPAVVALSGPGIELRTPSGKPSRLSRRGARWAAWGGAVLVVLGVVVGAFVLSLQRHDADLEAHGVAATASAGSSSKRVTGGWSGRPSR